MCFVAYLVVSAPRTLLFIPYHLSFLSPPQPGIQCTERMSSACTHIAMDTPAAHDTQAAGARADAAAGPSHTVDVQDARVCWGIATRGGVWQDALLTPAWYVVQEGW